MINKTIVNNKIELNKKYLIKNISKNDSIWKYSNPNTSQRRSYKYLGRKRGRLYRSTNKNKKYMIYDDIHNKFVSFGQMKYEDFTKHKNLKRRKNYLTRSAKIRGNWRKNPFSPNNLSRKILW
jgi:DNA modification methylase